jgi:hypothetical protein
MNMRRLISPVIYLALAVLSGCGGGDSTTATTTPPPAAAQPSAATLKLSTQGALPAGASIGALDVTVSLPAGVTVKADGAGQTAAGVMTPSAGAAGSLGVATFTPAAGGNPAKARIVMINASGIGTGEFVTVNCDIAAGSSPKDTDFSLAGFSAGDVNGTAIAGLTPAITADIK